jgi:hypothetical protein
MIEPLGVIIVVFSHLGVRIELTRNSTVRFLGGQKKRGTASLRLIRDHVIFDRLLCTATPPNICNLKAEALVSDRICFIAIYKHQIV